MSDNFKALIINQEGEKFLDSLNNRFDQMRDDLITWKEEQG